MYDWERTPLLAHSKVCSFLHIVVVTTRHCFHPLALGGGTVEGDMRGGGVGVWCGGCAGCGIGGSGDGWMDGG